MRPPDGLVAMATGLKLAKSNVNTHLGIAMARVQLDTCHCYLEHSLLRRPFERSHSPGMRGFFHISPVKHDLNRA